VAARDPNQSGAEQLVRSGVYFVPGLVALGLGVLYASGALVKSAQLIGEGANVRDILPLVPLEGILAVGIGTVVTSLLVLVTWTGIVAFYIWATRRQTKPITVPPETYRRLMLRPTSNWYRGLRASIWILVAITIAASLWLAPFFTAVISAASLMFAVIAAHHRQRGRRWTLMMLSIYFFVILAARIGNAFVYPEPLPLAEIRHEDGTKLSGTLLSVGNGLWIVSTGDREYRAIPADNVRQALVESQEREEEPEPILQLLWDEIAN
jgi:ABC-type multidrug transport system fused ATPase/permease subunit